MPMPQDQTESPMSRKSAAIRPARTSALRLYLAMLRRRAAGDEEGGTAIEYALIAAGVGAAIAATVYSVGATTQNLYQSVANLF